MTMQRLDVPYSLWGRCVRRCLLGPAKVMVESEPDLGHSCVRIFKMLESRFGSGDLISKQISKAHKTYGGIPSPQHGWDDVFLKTILHIRAITSMISLSKVEGQAGSICHMRPRVSRGNISNAPTTDDLQAGPWRPNQKREI